MIVEKEYLEELEAFKKSKAYLPNLSDIKLEYKDIVRIDTYKDSFIKYLEQTRVSIANQRALNIGQEKELMGAIDALSDMIKNVSKIGETRQSFEDKKEEEKKKKS